MDANKILTTDILDLLFEGKNKEYGAYDLRRTYGKRLLTALLITLGLLVLILLINFFANAFHKDVVKKDLVIQDVSLTEIKKEKPKPLPPPPPKAELPPPPAPKATVQFTPPVIKKDEEVKQDVKPPDQKQVQTQVVSEVTQQGKPDEGVVAPPVTPPGTGVVAAPPPDDNQVFTKVEIEAGLPSNWTKYITRNINATVPSDNGAPPGTYKVIVEFIVSKDGSVSNVHALTNFGYGMEEEAVRVIKTGPKWTPAIQNGRSVNAYRQQPIIFQVTGEE